MSSTTADHLAAVDLLRTRDLPEERGRSSAGSWGPGYVIAELLTSEDFWDEDLTLVEEVEEQYDAELTALALVLTERWGPPDIFSLWSLATRSASGEHIPDPWSELSMSVANLHLWQRDGRWIALGVGQQDRELPFQLLAVATTVDPP
ncbi:hypothetical protein [Streptomyces sp. NBC_01304]|uniref:hypothetical protein n=1 Tax=Streptomyces sp. NBC_01304 TaxID=2903818 RepID=UPI002E1035E9|nr:hypothetical protein OG430_43330 [Streptomyces sp. NBC_01304]